MKLLKKLIFIVLVCLLSAFTAGRVLFFKMDLGRLYKAIPDATIFLSEHDAFADRWKTILSSPASISIAETFGAEAKDLRELRENDVTQLILDRFGCERVLVGYTPSLRPGGEAGYVLASWVGAEGQFLRWGLYDSILDDFERVRFSNGRSGWIMRDVDVSGEMQSLTMAVAEGVLLGCLSRDDEGVRHLVQRLERATTLSPAVTALSEDGFEADSTPDRGWVRFWPTHTPIGSPRGWHFGLRFDEEGRMAGSIRGPILPPYYDDTNWSVVRSFSSEYDEGMRENFTELNNVLGPAPGVLAVLPFAYSQAALSVVDTNLSDIARTLSEKLDAKTPMFVSMTTSDYGGKLFEFAVPAVLFGLRLNELDDADALVSDLLDSLNARYGLGLIRRVAANSPSTVVAIDSATHGSLQRALGGVSPAYAVVDGWLVVSTSRSGLDSLVSKQLGLSAFPGTNRWSDEMRQVSGDVVTWMDLDSTASTTRKLIGLYDLYIRWKGLSRDSEVRQNLALLDAVMLRVQDMNSFCLWSDLDEARCEFKFLLGGKQSG